MENMNLNLSLTSYTKINLKQMINLNVYRYTSEILQVQFQTTAGDAQVEEERQVNGQ